MSSALGDGPCMGGHRSVARVEGPGRELVTSPWRWWCGGTHAGLCHCRGALGVQPGTPQVLAAAQGGVLRSWRAAGAGVSPQPCRGAAAPGRAAQPGGTPQLPNPPAVPSLELPLPPHSSPKRPPQQPSQPPAPSRLQPSWPPGPHCASPYLGIALSLWAHLLLLWLHNPRVVQGLLTAIPFPWGGHGPYLSEGQMCLPFRGPPVRRPHPFPESTTTLPSPFLPPRGGRCHLKDHPGHAASHDGLVSMLWGYLNKAQRMGSLALVNPGPRHWLSASPVGAGLLAGAQLLNLLLFFR